MTVLDFSLVTGQPLDARTQELLGKAHLDYRVIEDQEGQRAEIERLVEIGFDKPNWDAAWESTLQRFIGSGYDLDALNPLFVGSSTVHRWQGQYIEGIDHFERRFNTVFRDWLFRTFLSDITHLYEFGSGSGINVASYARMFPTVPVTGLDFAPAAVQIANLLGDRVGLKVKGRHFNFLRPRLNLELAPNGGVLTFCALEQVGYGFWEFLSFLRLSRPRRIVHVEPICDWYGETPFDLVARKYHIRRDYLLGMLRYLERLQDEGKIRIVYQRRTGFGSRFHEGYSVIVWEPL